MPLTPSLPGAAARRLGAVARLLRAWPWLQTLRTLRVRFRDDHLGVSASSLTFTTLIGLVPLMTVMLALFTAFPMFARFQQALQQYFLQALVPDSIARPVLQTLTQFAAKASRLGGLGLVLLGVTALALVFTIDRTLNGIWRVPRQRPLAQRVMLYWAALTLGPLLLGASLSLTSVALTATRGFVDDLPGGLSLLLALLQFALLSSGMAALYRFVPHTAVAWRHAWAGGVFVALGLEVAKRGLAWYVTKVPTFSVIYGAFATLPILLLWIYLVWVVVLLGAVVAAYAPTLALRVSRLAEEPGMRFALALRVLRALAATPVPGPAGRPLTALSAATGVDPLQVGQVLETLHALDWVGRLDEPGEPRWLLLVAPERTPAQPLVDALLLADRQASAAFRREAGLDRLTLAALL